MSDTSWVTVVWSAVAACCLTLALVHVLTGLRQRSPAQLWFAGNSASAAVLAGFELALMRAATPADYGSILRWMHVPIFVLVATLVLFVRMHFSAGSPWLGGAAVAARGAALAVNFLQRPNLNFVQISGLERLRLLGEDVSLPDGIVSRWTRLGELSSVLLLAFLVTAALQIARRGERRRAAIVGGSLILFVVAAAGSTSLVHAGLARAPYLISLSYLFVIAAMSAELTRDAVRTVQLKRQLQTSQDDLHESRRRLELAAEAANMGFWTWDSGTEVMWMTAVGRELRGYSPREKLDIRRFLETVHPEDRADVRRAIETAARDCGHFDLEYRIRHPDLGTRWIALRGSGERGEAGAAVVRGASTDVTRRKLAEAEAHKRQGEVAHLSRVTMLGELSGSLAHELNQPLAAILSNAQAAQRFLGQDGGNLDEVREILSDIVSEDRRAGEVIRRLRALLRKGEVRSEAQELPELIEDVLRLVRSDLVNRGVSLAVELPAGLPAVRGDRVQIEQVLLNLVSNGCDAMIGTPAGERRLGVRVLTADGDSAVRVSIADRGHGIPPDQVDRVFEPFVTSKSDGMGLGLTVCRTIVAAHGGRLWAENNAEGGATFHFTLPLFREAAG